MIFILIVLAYMIGIRIGTYGIFKKLGIAPHKAFIPIVCSNEWQKIIQRPKWWTWMLFIPGVNLFYMASQLTEMSTAFRRYGFFEHVACVLFALFYFPFLGFSKNEKFIGAGGVKPGQPPIKFTIYREWADAIVFAVVAAHIIRTFVFEAYMIPTESMEKTLLVGDFLFVSKFHYGARVPNTPLSIPFFHHTVPAINTNAYLEWIKLPYMKLPGFEKVKRNDMVVFNFPAGDTVTKEFESADPYYDIVRRTMVQYNVDYSSAREMVWQTYHIITRPVDKKENYIKRCVGLPGDKLEVRDGQLFINDAPAYHPENSQMSYLVKTATGNIPDDVIRENHILPTTIQPMDTGLMDVAFTDELALKFRTFPAVNYFQPNIDPKGNGDVFDRIFPNDKTHYQWNVDFFGPILIPKKGSTVQLNDSTFPQYARIIRVYENNTVERRDGKFFINGNETSTYTFKMDYYWLMGDNRHRSQDARFWGFVPEDHVVGKAWFVWMSWDSNADWLHKIRWNRLFRSIHNKWAPDDPKYTE